MAAALLLTACSQDDDDQASGESSRVALRIVSGIRIEGYTRAVDSRWEDDDRIGLFATTNPTTTIFTDEIGTVCSNLPYLFSDTEYETSTPSTTYRAFTGKEIYLPQTGVDVYAYYPYTATKTDGLTPVDPTALQIDLSDQSSQNRIDLMRADPVANLSRSNSVAQLLFRHELVKLQFNVKRGDDMLEGEITSYPADKFKVTVSGNTTAMYNVFTGVFSGAANPNTIEAVRMGSPATGFELSLEALVLPTDAALGTVTITIGTTTNTFNATDELTKGNKYIYNITLTATSIEVDKDKFTSEQW